MDVDISHINHSLPRLPDYFLIVLWLNYHITQILILLCWLESNLVSVIILTQTICLQILITKLTWQWHAGRRPARRWWRWWWTWRRWSDRCGPAPWPRISSRSRCWPPRPRSSPCRWSRGSPSECWQAPGGSQSGQSSPRNRARLSRICRMNVMRLEGASHWHNWENAEWGTISRSRQQFQSNKRLPISILVGQQNWKS